MPSPATVDPGVLNSAQATALRGVLRALEIPAEAEARIMSAARADGPRPEKWITTRRAAEILGVCRATVFRYRARGLLSSNKRSARCIRWPESRVVALAEGAGNREASP